MRSCCNPVAYRTERTGGKFGQGKNARESGFQRRGPPFFVEMRTRLVSVVSGFGRILNRDELHPFACQKSDVPVVFTKQYPNGVGHTVLRFLDLAGDASVHENIRFNAAAESEFLTPLSRVGRQDVVVTGAEAHVCILQTSLGLRHHGLPVRHSVDAIGFRTGLDEEIALRWAASEGIPAVKTEMVLFEWLRRAARRKFPASLPRIRELVMPVTA